MKQYLYKLKNYIQYKINREIGGVFFRQAVKQRPLRIIIGASRRTQKGWIPSEEYCLNLLKTEDWRRYFKENSIDALLAEHVWEHLTKKNGLRAATVCYKYLKKSGYLRIAIPDGLFPNKNYINHVKPGSNDPDASDHKVLYNYKSISKLFGKVGFKVHLLEYFDEKGRFHFKKWNKDDGMIYRSKRYDKRNNGRKLNYTSIVLDATKSEKL